MTTTTARLYAVPDPTQRPSFPWLLRLRRLARHAYDLAMSVPRGAVGWAVSTVTKWGRAVASAMPGLASALARAGRAATAVGILPIAASALTTPQILRPLLGAARRVMGAVSAPLTRLGGWVTSSLRALDPVGPAVIDLARRVHAVVSAAAGRLARLARGILGVRGLEHAATASRAASYAWLTRRVALAVTGSVWAAAVVPVGIAGLTLTLLHAPDAVDVQPTPSAPEAPAAEPSRPEGSVSEREVAGESVDTEAEPSVTVPMNRASRRAAQQAAARSRRR